MSIIALTEASGSLNTMNIVFLVDKMALYQNQMTGVSISYHLCRFLFCFYHVCPEFLVLLLVLVFF